MNQKNCFLIEYKEHILFFSKDKKSDTIKSQKLKYISNKSKSNHQKIISKSQFRIFLITSNLSR